MKAGTFKSISAKDLLKMHQTKVLNKKLESTKFISNTPKIGGNLLPGSDIDLDIIPSSNSFKSSKQVNVDKACNLLNVTKCRIFSVY